MSGKISKERRKKKPPVAIQPYWASWCPVCVEPKPKILPGLYRPRRGSKRTTFWACEDCQRFRILHSPVGGGAP